MKLTMNRIAGLKCPAGRKDRLVFDDEQRGLGVRITAGGGKSYLVQYNWHGQKRRIALDSCASISLAQAREAARAIMGDVAKDIDVAAEGKRKAAEDALTLRRLLDDWQALHLTGKRPRYARDAVRAIKAAFGSYLDAPAASLERKAVVRAIDGLTRKGSPAMAASTAAYGKACYGWAIKRGTLEANPFVNLPVAPTTKRERVLADDELAAIWRATERPGPFNSIVRLLMLTGQRREEVAGLTWAELSGDFSTWTLAANRTKNGKAHIVSLSEPAQDLLRNAVKLNEYVFPGLRGPFRGFTKAKAALDKASGVTNWVLHDLRRTLATGLQRLGVRLEVTEAALNHTSGTRGGIAGVYQRHDWALERRSALDAWGAKVLAIAEGRKAQGNIVPLPERG
jgi:integrase